MVLCFHFLRSQGYGNAVDYGFLSNGSLSIFVLKANMEEYGFKTTLRKEPSSGLLFVFLIVGLGILPSVTINYPMGAAKHHTFFCSRFQS